MEAAEAALDSISAYWRDLSELVWFPVWRLLKLRPLFATELKLLSLESAVEVYLLPESLVLVT